MGKFRDSQTAKNLLLSFAGESQARNRYTYFSRRAMEDCIRALQKSPGKRGLNGPQTPGTPFPSLSASMKNDIGNWPAIWPPTGYFSGIRSGPGDA